MIILESHKTGLLVAADDEHQGSKKKKKKNIQELMSIKNIILSKASFPLSTVLTWLEKNKEKE